MNKIKFVKKWKKIRQKNKSIYILKWTILTYLVCNGIQYFIRVLTCNPYQTYEELCKDQLLGLLLIPLLYLCNLYVYSNKERMYKNIKK